MENIDKLAPALVKAQGMIKGAKKGNKNDHFRAKYADLASCWEACGKALQANGLAVIQLPVEAPPGFIGLETIILHTSGQSIQQKFFMPLKDPSNPQAAGSALTYARRYALCSAVGICPVDDDGNAAAGKTSAAQPKADKPTVSPDYWKPAWQLHRTTVNIDGLKEVFRDVRNSNLEESYKKSVLTDMRNTIKELENAQTS